MNETDKIDDIGQEVADDQAADPVEHYTAIDLMRKLTNGNEEEKERTKDLILTHMEKQGYSAEKLQKLDEDIEKLSDPGIISGLQKAFSMFANVMQELQTGFPEAYALLYGNNHTEKAHKVLQGLTEADFKAAGVELTKNRKEILNELKKAPENYLDKLPEYRAENELVLMADVMHLNTADAVALVDAYLSRSNIPRIKSKKVESIDMALDKLNNGELSVWSIEKKDIGQILPFGVERKGSENPVSVYVRVDIEDIAGLKVSTTLEPFDRRIFEISCALRSAGNDFFSVAQIARLTFNAQKPNSNQLQKVDNSITKMSMARIYIDNREEATAYGRETYVLDAPLFPIVRQRRYINGQLVDGAIVMNSEPVLMQYAKSIKQVSSYSAELLQIPLSMNNKYIKLDDYLKSRILHSRKGKMTSKILFDTVNKHLGITDSREKRRTKGAIRELMEFYKGKKFITGYTADNASVTFYL